VPGHYDRFKDQPRIPSTGTTSGPAGMGSPPPSQNFGSNVVIGGGGNPGDAGGSTSRPPQGPVGGPPPPQSSPPPQGPVGGPPPPSPTPPPPDDDDDDKTNIFTDPKTGQSGIDTFISNITGLGTDQGFQLPAFGFTGILQGLNANNKFFDKLIEGNVTAKDRVTLVGLLKANANNPNVFDEALNQYADRNDLNAAEIIDLKNSLQSEVAGLERREEDFERLVEQYEAGRPQGFKEGVLSLTGQFDRSGPVDTPRITLENLRDSIGPDGEAYLKATNPQLYYSFTSPQTSQGIEELAGQAMSTGKTAEDRRYNARIMEARALAADKQSRQDANMAGSSPAFAPPTQPGTPPGTQPPAPPMQPPPGASPTPAPPSRTPTPFDYSQFPQFDDRNYKMGGLGTTPQFGDFNETLNRFFRFQ
jgi:hypothetical protein